MEPDIHVEPLLRNVNIKWGKKKIIKKPQNISPTLLNADNTASGDTGVPCLPSSSEYGLQSPDRCPGQHGTGRALLSPGQSWAGEAASAVWRLQTGPVRFCVRLAPPALHNFLCKLLQGMDTAQRLRPQSTGLQLSPLVGFKNSTKHP